jgi:hypothetical protein
MVESVVLGDAPAATLDREPTITASAPHVPIGNASTHVAPAEAMNTQATMPAATEEPEVAAPSTASTPESSAEPPALAARSHVRRRTPLPMPAPASNRLHSRQRQVSHCRRPDLRRPPPSSRRRAL